jgi:5'-nucleotidase
MRILITNDDGVYAPGLAALHKSLSAAHEVTVVAPETEQSAVGHAITLSDPLRVRPLGPPNGYRGYAVAGTPADCVKLALNELSDEPPELVVSGINKGANLGFNLLYSGTVSAASEAALQGIPSIAISLATHDPQADFSFAGKIAAHIVALYPSLGVPPQAPLNVNVPALPPSDIRGIRLSRQSQARLRERLIPRVDPRGNTYYWQAGETFDAQEDPQADYPTTMAGYVSITPLSLDLTHDGVLKDLCSKKFELPEG